MFHILEHVFIHAIKDNVKIIPFLFITYCIMEYMEHAMSEKSEDAVKYSGKMGPLFGGILGIVPQCGKEFFLFRTCKTVCKTGY